MPKPFIDLRSDTVTRPSQEMLEAMFGAKVGDDVFHEDPTVNALQDKIAKLFNMEASLFFPSGTMANQVAIKIQTNPGDQIICDKDAHIYHYESGGVAFNSGASCSLIDGNYGQFTSEDVRNNINKPEFYHTPLSKLVAVENTANRAGGTFWDFSELIAIKAVCNDNNLKFHLDGARLWNALVETDELPEDYGNLFDTISVCLSKGLGCPGGSLLISSSENINKALRYRKVFGGNMRQIGYYAAAGIYSLDNNRLRLKNDHIKAKELGEALEKLPVIERVQDVKTNIVIFYLNTSIDESVFIEKLKHFGIYIIAMGGGKLRIVTHLDYSDQMHHYVIKTLASINFI